MNRFEVVVVGAGPAGVLAALRAADLGARTALVSRDELGGMAANDGPVPVRTLAHAARLLREARQLSQYGIRVSEPVLDYSRLLERTREVVEEVRRSSALRQQLESADVTLYEESGTARFIDPHTIVTKSGRTIRGEKFVLCTGGASRRLEVPGSEWTATHSDAWALRSVPPSMLVIGGGATGAQVASIFNSFGCHVELFQSGPRLLASEDEEVSAAMAAAFRDSGIVVRENFGTVESFEKTAGGVRMNYSNATGRRSAGAALAVVAIGWVANTAELNLGAARVELGARGFLRVDPFLQTTAPHVFAAGDIIGGLMLAPQAMQEGFVAGTNAVQGPVMQLQVPVSPIGSFTDPEYAQVGPTEAEARARYDVVVSKELFDSTTRAIIDGRRVGFCKLIVERASRQIIACHLVGERAVDIAQVAATAIAGRLSADELARVPLSFPTYAGILCRAAARAARTLNADAYRGARHVRGG